MSTQTTPTKTTPFSDPYPYPTCWQDDSRVQVLLAPFRDRNVNVENYNSKMKFWIDTIQEYCLFKGKVNFCKQELRRHFTKNQRVPSCLDTVLQEMQRKQIIRLRKDYEYDPENSWSGWALNNLKKPFTWGLDKIKVRLGATYAMDLGVVQFIHLEVINKYCEELLEVLLQPPYLGQLYHYDVLQKEVSETLHSMSEESLRICLHTLNVRKKIGLEYKLNTKEMQIHLVKIPSKENNDVTITETDNAIHNLQITKSNLEKQLDDIELEVKINENKARQYIKENKRLLAKNVLRKKQLLEKNHERRSLALNNIETLLSNVYEAKLNGVILDAYKFGSEALQTALNSSNLKYDNVDEIVADVRETMDSFREIQNNLSNANFNDSLASPGEEDELERELKEIIGESHPTTPIKSPENMAGSIPTKVQITDVELLDMLNELEIEENSPEQYIKKDILNA